VGSIQGARSPRRDVRDFSPRRDVRDWGRDVRDWDIRSQMFGIGTSGIKTQDGFQLCHYHTLAKQPAALSESSERGLRRRTLSSGGTFSKPSVPFPIEQVLVRRTSYRSIYGLRGVVLKSAAVTVEVPEQQMTETSSARKPHYKPGRMSSRPFEVFKRRCPGEAKRFSKFRNGNRTRPQGPETTINPASLQALNEQSRGHR